MCGAIGFTAEIADTFSACYCKMCQRWSAGMFMGVHTKSLDFTRGEDKLTVFKSSEWANRAFCSVCGSNIYYHAPEFGGPSVGLGLLDDTSALTIEMQHFIDKKPAGFTIKEESKARTTAEIEAIYGEMP